MHQLHQPQFYMVEVGNIVQIRINFLAMAEEPHFSARCHCLARGVLGQPQSHGALGNRDMKHSECPFPAWLCSSLTQQQRSPRILPEKEMG